MKTQKKIEKILMLLSQNFTDQAAAQLQKILAKDKQCYDAWQLLGATQIMMGKIDDAIQSINASLLLNDHYAPAYVNLAHCYIEKKDNEHAIQCATHALTIDPKLTPAWLKLGIAQLYLGQIEKALSSFGQGLKLNPGHAELLTFTGIAMAEKNDHPVAIHYYNEAIKNDKQCHDAWQLLGATQIRMGRIDDAIQSINVSLLLNDHYAPAYSNLAHCYIEKKDNEQAIQCATHALTIDPKLTVAWLKLGVAQLNLGQIEKALSSFDQGLKLNPGHAELLTFTGIAMGEKNDHPVAIHYYNEAIKNDNNHINAYVNMAASFTLLGKYQDAIHVNEKALFIDSNHKTAKMIQGTLLFLTGKHTEANALYRDLEERHRNDPNIEYNHGNALRSVLKIKESVAIHSNLVKRYPDFWRARADLGMNLLMLGDFKNGFYEYEYRLRIKDYAQSVLQKFQHIAKWEGEKINGKTVLVFQEGGHGDAIQMLRYVPFLKQHYGCNVILCLQRELHALFQHLGFPLTDRACPADFCVSLMSLAYIFKTDISNIPPPISIEGGCLNRIPNRIGIAWRGNHLHKQNRQRSVDLKLLSPLLHIPGMTYICLQKELTDEEIDFMHAHRIEQPHLGSFKDTVCALTQCEFVITIDKVIAHLAASMGIPTWILTAYVPDWRWMLDRKDSPWYPTVQLFRQSSLDCWTETLEEVCSAIKTKKNC